MQHLKYIYARPFLKTNSMNYNNKYESLANDSFATSTATKNNKLINYKSMKLIMDDLQLLLI